MRLGSLTAAMTVSALGGCIFDQLPLAMSGTESGQSTGSTMLVTGAIATAVGMIIWRHTIVQQPGAVQQWVAP